MAGAQGEAKAMGAMLEEREKEAFRPLEMSRRAASRPRAFVLCSPVRDGFPNSFVNRVER